MSLDRRNHAGHHILPTEHAFRFGLEASPRAGREFAQQLPIEAGVQSQTRLGMVKTTCRCATGKQTSSATWMAVSKVRFRWRFDVNNDGAVSPIDALLIINDLNLNGSRTLAASDSTPPFWDVPTEGGYCNCQQGRARRCRAITLIMAAASLDRS